MRRYEKLCLLRAACEESWQRSADLKHQRDREELNSRRYEEQTDDYIKDQRWEWEKNRDVMMFLLSPSGSVVKLWQSNSGNMSDAVNANAAPRATSSETPIMCLELDWCCRPSNNCMLFIWSICEHYIYVFIVRPQCTLCRAQTNVSLFKTLSFGDSTHQDIGGCFISCPVWESLWLI